VASHLCLVVHSDHMYAILWGVKAHQNTVVRNFSKYLPILIEIGVQCLR